MMSNARLSIVIPVCNSARWLTELFKALQALEGEALEFVIVDDASSDDSWPAIQEFAATEPRVRAMRHASNRGAAASKNSGILAASGDWIGFCDADDLPSPGRYAALRAHAMAHGLDVVYANAYRFTDTPRPDDPPYLQQPKPEGVVTGVAWLNACHHGNEIPAPAWLTLVSRRLIDRHGLRFPEGSMIDDVRWTAELLCVAERVAYLPDRGYGYRLNPESATQHQSPRHTRQRIESLAHTTLDLFALAAQQPVAARPGLQHLAKDTGRMAVAQLMGLQRRTDRAATFRRLQSMGLLQAMRQVHAGSRFWRQVWRMRLECLFSQGSDRDT